MDSEHQRAGILTWIATSIVVFAALLRMLVAHSSTPWWDFDPLVSWNPETTLTPAMGLMLDAVTWLAACVIIGIETAARRDIHWQLGILVLAGAVGVALHAFVIAPIVSSGSSEAVRGDFEALVTGSGWAAAFVGAWAICHSASDLRLRRIMVITLLSIVLILFAKGAYQAFVEHPHIVESFEADPVRMLASQGWEPGSTSARLFERRLRQREATGWFGLSNVYGSVAAACTVAWLGILVGAWRGYREQRVSSGEVGAIALVATAAGGALALAASKGAVGAVLVGCVLLAAPALSGVLRLRSLFHRIAPWLGLATIAAVLMVIAARGYLGDSLDERSLLFRSQYLSASSRIIAEQPWFGVGPEGFKDAYLLAKDPTSPEEIDSPHSVLFDWVARLGVFGATWALLWVWWICRASANLRATPSPVGVHAPMQPRLPLLNFPTACATAMICGAAVVGMSIESAALGADMILLLALASVGSVWIVALVDRTLAHGSQVWFDRAIAGAALALAAHAMIEVTPVTPGAAAWFLCLCAIAGRAGGVTNAVARADLTTSHRRSWRGALAATLILSGTIGVGWSAIVTWKWERSLASAALALKPVADAQSPIARAGASGSGVDAGRFWAAQIATIPLAVGNLDRAAAQIPTAWTPRLAAARLEMNLAFAFANLVRADEAILRANASVRRYEAHLSARPGASAAWGQLGAALDARARVHEMIADDSESAMTDRAAAVEAWRGAELLDPHGLTPALALWQLATELGDEQLASASASRALEIDERLKLDPLKGLTDAERTRLAEILAERFESQP